MKILKSNQDFNQALHMIKKYLPKYGKEIDFKSSSLEVCFKEMAKFVNKMTNFGK